MGESWSRQCCRQDVAHFPEHHFSAIWKKNPLQEGYATQDQEEVFSLLFSLKKFNFLVNIVEIHKVVNLVTKFWLYFQIKLQLDILKNLYDAEAVKEFQKEVLDAIISQAESGNDAIIGAMIESNLEAGNQKFPAPKESLKRGVSITDGCIDWATTEASILNAYDRLASRFASV